MEEISRIRKKVKKTISGEAYDVNENRIKGALRPRARTGLLECQRTRGWGSR